MKKLTTSMPPSQGRIRRHGRFFALCAVCTLTTVAAVWLASPGPPFLDTPEPVAVGVAAERNALVAPPSAAPEPINFAKLERPSEIAAPPARQAGPPARPAITIKPDSGAPDFVPTPEPPTPTLETLRPVAAQPAAPAHIDDPTHANQPARAKDTVANIQYQKLDMALQQVLDTDPATPVRVILRTARGAHEMAAWLAAEGRQIHQLHPSIGGLTATLSASDVAALTTDSNVQRMSIDAVVHATAEPVSGDVFRETLGLDALGGVISGGEWIGTGVRVALVDSGIKAAQDLHNNRILAFFDFTQPADQAVVSTRPTDDYGHGTHVAGLIGGTGKDSDGEWQGPAPAADFIGFKVLNKDGAGYTSDVLAAIDYAVQQNASFGIDVMNLSLGHPIFEPAATDPLVQAVEAAVASGIVVVTSAGNIGINPETGEVGYAGITSPGNAQGAITVGSLDLHYTATRFDDTVGSYSSRGPTWYDAFAKGLIYKSAH